MDQFILDAFKGDFADDEEQTFEKKKKYKTRIDYEFDDENSIDHDNDVVDEQDFDLKTMIGRLYHKQVQLFKKVDDTK